MLGEAAPRKTGLPAAPRGSQLLCGLSVDPLSRHLFLNSASQQVSQWHEGKDRWICKGFREVLGRTSC
ncbi:hypothetical protein BS78_05G264300 [Paspalum vaginatum]|nr:hypothetical protein BS78_05G264300 [Paspalum vaginatum]